MKLVMCLIPLSWQYIPVKFMWSLIRMLKHSKDFEVKFISKAGGYIDEMRNELVEDAMKSKPDYLLWLDADQAYPNDTIEKLVRHIDTGKMIVGGMVREKYSGKPCLYNLEPGLLPGNVKMKQPPILEGMIKVDASSMGGVMMKPEVFDKIDFPYFKTEYKKDGSHYGEDMNFYIQCKDKGIDAWCDTDLKFGHIRVQIVT